MRVQEAAPEASESLAEIQGKLEALLGAATKRQDVFKDLSDYEGRLAAAATDKDFATLRQDLAGRNGT